MNGWYFATGKKLAAGKSSKEDAKAVPSKSFTPTSAVADAVALAFGAADRQSSTPGSKRDNAKEVMPPEGVSRKQTSRADTRPRPASLLAGAAGIKDSLIPVVSLPERMAMIDELIPPLYFGKLILAQAMRGR